MARDRKSAPHRHLPRGVRMAAVVSGFHGELTAAMLESAREELLASGLAEEDLEVAHVAGSFEIPLVARRFARRRDIDAVLCLGVVLKGETTHDEHVARGAVEGIGWVSLETDKPVLLGVLTCQTLDQARERALPPDRGGRQDKGREVAQAAVAALAALEVASGRVESRS